MKNRSGQALPSNSTEGGKRPPLHARLFWYLLSPSELVLLSAMVEHCSDGSSIRPSIARLAAYSKLSYRKVQYLIHDFRKRHVLIERAPHSRTKHKPAIYMLNEAALEEDPKMVPYRSQRSLPDIRRPWDPDLTHAEQEPHAQHALDLTHAVQEPHAQGADNPKTCDPKPLDPRAGIQHSKLAPQLNSVPAWLTAKEEHDAAIRSSTGARSKIAELQERNRAAILAGTKSYLDRQLG